MLLGRASERASARRKDAVNFSVASYASFSTRLRLLHLAGSSSRLAHRESRGYDNRISHVSFRRVFRRFKKAIIVNQRLHKSNSILLKDNTCLLIYLSL